MNRELAELFAELAPSGEEILYRPNPGNAGDSLIAHATYAFFRDAGVRWSAASDEPGSGEGRVVAYGGGGNLVPGYTDARSFLEAHVGRCRALVLLPHTVAGNEDLLSRLGPEVHLFLRDERSYGHCEAHARGASLLHRAHDMALGTPVLDTRPVGWGELLSAWFSARARRKDLARALRYVMTDRIRRCDHLGRTRPRGAIIDAFRTDSESTGWTLSPGNRDLSKLFELGDMSPRLAGLSARLLMGRVTGASLVRTNRLHVAIACCLKNVPVEIHANATTKVRDVFERSIEGRFPHARWVGAHSAGG